MSIWDKIIEAQSKGRQAALATVVETFGYAPREAGAKMLVYEDGAIEGTIGGGAVEKAVIEECMSAIREKAAKLIEYDLSRLQMSCGGRMKVFIEPFSAAAPLIIFGAGHIGRALAVISDLIGFRVTVVDDRSEFANAVRFPHADKVLAEDYKSALEKLNFTPETFIIIVTHRHQHDREILEYCIRRPFAYLGMIGSQTKVRQTFEALEQLGIAREALRRVHSPVGLSIGAQTPEEIAVSIAAEMIAVRSGADVSSLSMKLKYD